MSEKKFLNFEKNIIYGKVRETTYEPMSTRKEERNDEENVDKESCDCVPVTHGETSVHKISVKQDSSLSVRRRSLESLLHEVIDHAVMLPLSEAQWGERPISNRGRMQQFNHQSRLTNRTPLPLDRTKRFIFR